MYILLVLITQVLWFVGANSTAVDTAFLNSYKMPLTPIVSSFFSFICCFPSLFSFFCFWLTLTLMFASSFSSHHLKNSPPFFLLSVLFVLSIRKPWRIYNPAVVADPQVVLQLLVFDTGSNPDAARRPGNAKPFPLFACSRWEFHCCRLTCAVQIFYARLQGMQTAAQPSLRTQGCPLTLMLSSLLFTLFGTVQFFQSCFSLPAE